MKTNIIILWLLSIVLLSCNKHKTSKLDSDYQAKKELLKAYCGDYFVRLENNSLLEDEAKYLKFLFTYMPLSDFADYDYDFYLAHVRASIDARNSFEWAKNIPEDIFMRYVLPPRMNNENMDSARLIFLPELKKRFIDKKFTMEQATLEINHWCHEKANYLGTDERTIAPLGICKRTFGRCGEESTFTTTALRTAGIPARQVYTPRWAHTDDNHAWVEVWIDGSWHYLGACEPAAILDRGWFDVPATRAMLIFAKEFGKPESVDKTVFLSETDNYTAVNSIAIYAPTKNIEVLVVDSDDKPVDSAVVQFQLYNYAEMFPILSQKTDKTGKANLKTGFGTLDIYVSTDSCYTVKTVAAEEQGQIKIILDGNNIKPAEYVRYNVPKAGNSKEIAPELEKNNAERCSKEDSIRENYIKTFYNKEKVDMFRKKYNYSEYVSNFFINSRGNYKEIEKFLIYAAENNKHNEAIKLLNVISQKDLVDTYSEILKEHLDLAYMVKDSTIPDGIFEQYVLNPRISYEMLKKYRQIITENYISEDKKQNFKNEPEKLAKYILENIKTEINNKKVVEINCFGVIITPSGVQKVKICNENSLKIYFIAVCRTLGIPAQLEAATGVVRVYKNGEWKDIILDKNIENKEIKRGKIRMKSAEEGRELKYRINFALARLNEQNIFRTVDLDWEIPIRQFAEGVDLQTGEYMLLSSIRLETGDVIVKRKYFTLNENHDTTILVDLPKVEINNVNKIPFMAVDVANFNNGTVSFEKIKNKEGFTAICWIKPSGEPSKHIIRDINPMLKELNNNNIKTLFFVNEIDFNAEKEHYPTNLNYFYDKNFALLNKNMESGVSSCERIELPIIMLINSNDEIIYKHSGYIIGIGDALLNNSKIK